MVPGLKEMAEELLSVLNDIINAKYAEKYKVLNLFEDKADIVSTIEEIIDGWEFIRAKVGKYLYSSMYNYNIFASVVERYEQISQLEYKYFDMIFLLTYKLQ